MLFTTQKPSDYVYSSNTWVTVLIDIILSTRATQLHHMNWWTTHWHSHEIQQLHFNTFLFILKKITRHTLNCFHHPVDWFLWFHTQQNHIFVWFVKCLHGTNIAVIECKCVYSTSRNSLRTNENVWGFLSFFVNMNFAWCIIFLELWFRRKLSRQSHWADKLLLYFSLSDDVVNVFICRLTHLVIVVFTWSFLWNWRCSL